MHQRPAPAARRSPVAAPGPLAEPSSDRRRPEARLRQGILVWLATVMLLHSAPPGNAAKADEIPVIDVLVVVPEGFESDVSAARLINDASKIYESNGLLSLRFAGLVRAHPIPELLTGD